MSLRSAAKLAEVICPKCSDIMTTYERNGVHVDQCAACKGIFLDRGELERLAAAERHHYDGEVPTPVAPPPVAPPPPPPAQYGPPPDRDMYGAPRERSPYDWLDERDRSHYDSRRYRDEHHHKRRKKKDFLDVLFDL